MYLACVSGVQVRASVQIYAREYLLELDSAQKWQNVSTRQREYRRCSGRRGTRMGSGSSTYDVPVGGDALQICTHVDEQSSCIQRCSYLMYARVKKVGVQGVVYPVDPAVVPKHETYQAAEKRFG